MRTVAGGGAVFGAGVASRVLTLSTMPGAVADSQVPGGLTEREHDVLSLVAEGARNAEIARALGLSLKQAVAK